MGEPGTGGERGDTAEPEAPPAADESADGGSAAVAPALAPPSGLEPLPRRLRARLKVLRDPAALRRHDLRLADLRGLLLEDLDLSGLDLTGARFDEALLRRVALRGATLDGAVFRTARLVRCDLSRVRAAGVDLHRADLRDGTFEGADLAGASFRRARLRGVDLGGADLRGADLREATLRGGRLDGARLSGARTEDTAWKAVDLLPADLGGVDLGAGSGIPWAQRQALRARGVRVRSSAVMSAWVRLPVPARAALVLVAAASLPVAWVLLRPVPLKDRAPRGGPAAVAQGPPASPLDPSLRVARVDRDLSAPRLPKLEEGFDDGDVVGWASAGGQALAAQPICTDPASGEPLPPLGVTGRCWVNSEMDRGADGQPARSHGDDPVGTLTSGPFVVPKGVLVFHVGGGAGPNNRVELLVDGTPVLEASGKDTVDLREVRWDLAPYAGKEGRLAVVDLFAGSWGRTLADGFRVEEKKGP